MEIVKEREIADSFTNRNASPFEEYLKDIHAEEYTGTDDDMPDAFDDWLGALDADEFITYANDFGRSLLKRYGK